MPAIFDNLWPTLLSCIIALGAKWASSSFNFPCFCAVLKIPTPKGFVRNKWHPSSAVSLRLRSLIATRPVTANPKIGSGLSILCPPARGMPASAHILRPPSNTCCATSGANLSRGHPNMAIAKRGSPPIAYTSLMALAAAIRPNEKGSSTMGIKKSVVLIIPVPSPKSYTAASSLLSLPTNR